ncbi:hypothetical protein E4U38_001719 [Claviceps purpurea]|nr:hypothetical protein E4U38_001719 [Claviceps purpurea]
MYSVQVLWLETDVERTYCKMGLNQKEKECAKEEKGISGLNKTERGMGDQDTRNRCMGQPEY